VTGRRFDWRGEAVAVVCDDAAMLARAEAYLGLPTSAVAGEGATIAVETRRDGHQLRGPFGRLTMAGGADGAYALLEAIAHVFATHTRRLVVHAGAFVGADGGAVVYFGVPFAGKSGLTHAAWRRGLTVIGDDRLWLDTAAGTVRAFPKCLKIRMGDGPPPAGARGATAAGDAFVGALRGDRRLVVSRRAGGFAGYDAAYPVRAMAPIARGAETALVAAPSAEGLGPVLAGATLAATPPMALIRLAKRHAPGGRPALLRIADGDFAGALDILTTL